MTLDWPALVLAIFGGGLFGGIAQYIRARGQNTADDRSALTTEQQQFRLAMAAELAELRTEIRHLKEQNAALDGRNDQLVKENGELSGRVRFLEEQNADLKNRIMNESSEKESLRRELDRLRTQVQSLDRRQP